MVTFPAISSAGNETTSFGVLYLECQTAHGTCDVCSQPVYIRSSTMTWITLVCGSGGVAALNNQLKNYAKPCVKRAHEYFQAEIWGR